MKKFLFVLLAVIYFPYYASAYTPPEMCERIQHYIATKQGKLIDYCIEEVMEIPSSARFDFDGKKINIIFFPDEETEKKFANKKGKIFEVKYEYVSDWLGDGCDNYYSLITAQEVSSNNGQNPVMQDIGNYRSYFYKVFDSRTVSGVADWSSAAVFCDKMFGELAVIDSAEENTYIYNWLTAQNVRNVYFGLTDLNHEGIWLTVNKTLPPFFNWADGEPNNEGGREHYAMFYHRSPPGKWNDGIPGNSFFFLCKWRSQESFLKYKNTVSTGNPVVDWGNNTVENKPTLPSSNAVLQAKAKKIKSQVDAIVNLGNKQVGTRINNHFFQENVQLTHLSSDKKVLLDKLKKQMMPSSVDIDDFAVPDEIYQAFAESIIKILGAKKIEKLSTDPYELINEIYSATTSWFDNSFDTVVIDGVEYKVNFDNSIGYGIASVEWKGRNNKHHNVTLVWAKDPEEGMKTLVDYCNVLVELNKELWIESITYFYIPGGNHASLGEKVINAICDKKKANDLVKEIGKAFEKEFITVFGKNKFQKFIEKTLPDGKHLVEIAAKVFFVKKQGELIANLIEDGKSYEKDSVKLMDACLLLQDYGVITSFQLDGLEKELGF